MKEEDDGQVPGWNKAAARQGGYTSKKFAGLPGAKRKRGELPPPPPPSPPPPPGATHSDQVGMSTNP